MRGWRLRLERTSALVVRLAAIRKILFVREDLQKFETAPPETFRRQRSCICYSEVLLCGAVWETLTSFFKVILCFVNVYFFLAFFRAC